MHRTETTVSEDAATQRIPTPAVPKRTERPWMTESYLKPTHPTTRASRGLYIRVLSIMSAAVIVFMMACLPIYWGALWETPTHARGLNAWVVVRPAPPPPCFSS